MNSACDTRNWGFYSQNVSGWCGDALPQMCFGIPAPRYWLHCERPISWTCQSREGAYADVDDYLQQQENP